MGSLKSSTPPFDIYELIECVKAMDLSLFELSLDRITGNIEVKQDENTVSLSIQLLFPFGSYEAAIKNEIEEQLKQSFPKVGNWVLQLSSKINSHKAVNAVKPLEGIKNIIAVGSGKGGVGKSSTTVNLALALQALGAQVGILDADIYGPNLALMLGVADDTRPEVEAQKYFLPLEVKGLQTMSMSYVTTEDTPMVWRGPKASGAFSQLLSTTLWRELDYLLIDLPPGTGDIQLTMAQTVPVNAALIVTTPQNMATQDAQKGIQMFRKVQVPVLGIIENMSTHICSQCAHEDHIFGQGGGELLAQKYATPYLGALPLDATIREDCDAGFPTVAKAPESDISQRYRELALRTAVQLANSGEVINSPAIKVVSE